MRDYCKHCHYPKTTCVCDAITRIHSPVEIVILQHNKETAHAKNTARLVKLCIPETDIVIGNTAQCDAIETLSHEIASRRAALIYPTDNSIPIESTYTDDNPTSGIETLVFIDASWRQALAMFRSIPWLQCLPAFHFSDAPTSRYDIRHTKLSYSLSTLEAVQYCLTTGWGIDAKGLASAQDKLISHWQGPSHHRRARI